MTALRMPTGRAAKAVLFLLLVAAVPAVPAPALPPSSAAVDGVVGFGGDAAHTGVVAGPGPENFGRLLWEVRTGGAVRSSPVLAGESLYFGSTDGFLYAVDAASGRMSWRYSAGVPIVSGVAADTDRVYFVDRANTVYAVDRSSGAAAWQRATGPDLPLPWGLEGWDYFTSTPTLAGGNLLVTSGDGNLYALDPATGRDRWVFDAGARLRSSPSVADGVTYFGTGDGVVHAVSLADGTSLWQFATRGHELDHAGFDRKQIYPTPAVANGVVYIGSRDRYDYALDAATGELRWESEDGTSGWVISSAAIGPERVYSARSSSQIVRALDPADGAELWRYRAPGAVFASPVRAAASLYVADGTGNVTALEPDSGTPRWSYRPGGAIWATPVVAGERMFVGTDDGSVYALATRAGEPVRLAVYHDPGLRGRSAFGSSERHDLVVEYFASHGYDRLDWDGTTAFMARRVADRAPSVVVFAMDAVPASAAGSDGPLRAYLEAGGKVVWLGHAPLFLEFDAEGNIVGTDSARAGELLGLDLTGYNTDSYDAILTEAGRRMGLESRWQSHPWAATGTALGAVLAHDDIGQPLAFARPYGGPEGTGFVALYPTIETGRLDEIRRVVEYGVLRSPAARRVDTTADAGSARAAAHPH